MKEDSMPADHSEVPRYPKKTVGIGSSGHALANVGASDSGGRSSFLMSLDFVCPWRMDANVCGVDVESATIATASESSTVMEVHL